MRPAWKYKNLHAPDCTFHLLQEQSTKGEEHSFDHSCLSTELDFLSVVLTLHWEHVESDVRLGKKHKP